MWHKRAGALIFLAAVITALMAVSAQAAVWQVGETKFKSGQTETNSIKIKSSVLLLQSTVLGAPVKISATGIECLECKMEQIGTGEEGLAQGSGKYKFTGLTVVEPKGCTMAAPIVSEPVKKTTRTRKGWFFTENHELEESAQVALVKLEGCAASGSYKLTGTLAAKTAEVGVLSVAQVSVFSAAVQEEDEATLKLAGNVATLTGEVNTQLSGANAGKAWGTVTK